MSEFILDTYPTRVRLLFEVSMLYICPPNSYSLKWPKSPKQIEYAISVFNYHLITK